MPPAAFGEACQCGHNSWLYSKLYVIALELVSEHQPQQLNTTVVHPGQLGLKQSHRMSLLAATCASAPHSARRALWQMPSQQTTVTNGMFTDQGRPMLTKQN